MLAGTGLSDNYPFKKRERQRAVVGLADSGKDANPPDTLQPLAVFGWLAGRAPLMRSVVLTADISLS